MASAGAKGDKGGAVAEWSAASRLEVRVWEKLNPQGDVYSPRTGHTVTSTGEAGGCVEVREGG